MRYLLDADWLISFLNGRVSAVQLVAELAEDGIAVSVITWGEVYEGLLRSPASERHLAQFDEFTATVDLLTPDTEVARHYAQIRSSLRSQGQLLPDNDLWIAATARARNLILVSRDQHFSRIADLAIYQPS